MSNASSRLRHISARLRETGQVGVRAEMNSALLEATVFLEAEVRAAAGQRLPQRGGLARQQSTQEIRRRVIPSGSSAGVRLSTATRGSMQTDKGYVRHPVFGVWLEGQKSQQIPGAAGWWSKTLEQKSPMVTPVLLKVMEATAAKIQGV